MAERLKGIVLSKQRLILVRRYALQIAAQLPENIEQSLQILDATRELILGFLSKPR